MNELFKETYSKLISEAKAAGQSKSVICRMSSTLTRLDKYLSDENLLFSPETASDWVWTKLQPLMPYSQFKGKRWDVYRVATILFPEGNIKPLFYREEKLKPYDRLPRWAQNLIDEYCRERLEENPKFYFNHKQRACHFLLHAIRLGFDGFSQIDALMVAKCVFEVQLVKKNASNFISYLEKRGIASRNASLAFNKYYAPKILVFAEKNEHLPKGQWSMDEYLSVADKICRLMNSYGYSSEAKEQAKGTISEFGLYLDVQKIGFSMEAIDAFIRVTKEDFGLHTQTKRRTLLLILNILEGKTEDPIPQIFRSKKYAFPVWAEKIVGEYYKFQKKRHLSSSALDMDRSALLRFCSYFDSIGIKSFKELDGIHVKNFVLQDCHSTAEGKAAYNYKIRGFLHFLFNQSIVNTDLSGSIPTIPADRIRPVEILTENALQKIDTYVSSTESLRNAAILKIGIQTGLRASDIIGLEMDSIDWDNQVFRIIQRKTKKEMLVPFSAGIGNALYRYITEERPKVKDTHVFIEPIAPFRPLHANAAQNAISKALGKRQGFHIIRKTFASRITASDITFNRVSEILGHSGTKSIDTYISVDVSRLKQCAIPMGEMFKYKGGLL